MENIDTEIKSIILNTVKGITLDKTYVGRENKLSSSEVIKKATIGDIKKIVDDTNVDDTFFISKINMNVFMRVCGDSRNIHMLQSLYRRNLISKYEGFNYETYYNIIVKDVEDYIDSKLEISKEFRDEYDNYYKHLDIKKSIENIIEHELDFENLTKNLILKNN